MQNIHGLFGRFFQIGYVTHDVRRAVEMLTRQMGAHLIDLFEDFRDDAGNPVALKSLSHLVLGGTELEIIQPRLDWPSLYLDALPNGPDRLGLHHLGYIHADLAAWEEALCHVVEHGFGVAAQGGNSRARFAYIDTRSEIGHYTEMVHRMGDSVWKFPI